MMAAPSNRAEALVRVDGIKKSYGRFTAIDDVHFTIRAGEILGLIGPNGAGKTTLFECIAGVQPANGGSVLSVDGMPLQPRSSLLFYVPDAITPWPQQTVRWALEFMLGYQGGRRASYDEVVADLQLGPLMHTRVGALSKGQRKRTLLGIGLLAPQSVLLIDEPFEGLDLRQSRELESTLRKHAMAGRTLFLSIHQIADAARICDRFVLLSGGRVVAEGVLDELRALAKPHLTDPTTTDFEEIFLALT